MILVVGSQHDSEARNTVARWADRPAALLSAEDFHFPGWHLDPARPERSVAVAAGVPIPVQEIRSVLVRRPWLLPDEFAAIDPDDREYVCAETNAFLAAWLDGLSCRVVNRGSPRHHMGPGWSQEAWCHAAGMAGISVLPRQSGKPVRELRSVDGEAEGNAYEITVVGTQCLGTDDQTLSGKCLKLASLAGVEFACFAFLKSTGEFIQASVFPRIQEGPVEQALLDLLVAT